jgi:glutamine cyclotransferase
MLQTSTLTSQAPPNLGKAQIQLELQVKSESSIITLSEFSFTRNWETMSSRLDYFHKIFLSFALVISLLYGGSSAAAPSYGYKVVAKYPHSTDSYTEGFFYLDGMFYEGTGIKGRSAVLVIDPKTGRSVQRRDLPAEYFGEGIVDWGPNIYEWTWKSHVCFVYDRLSLRPVKQFTYSGEGWGMTRTKKELITSDGTATLRFRDPHTFRETHHIVVKEGSIIVDRLNELEFIKGEIYANVWHSNMIARISPHDGHVIAWIDLTGLLPPDQMIDAESVLNGIAYDPRHDRLFVTGKQWPTVFEIKVIQRTVTDKRHVPE